ncbi:MAG TPA: class I SAM-dependent methyltransferase [Polyangiaceae bacterium]
MSSDYDRLAEAYGRHRKGSAGVLRELVNGARLTADSRVLEIGAGTGNYTAALCEVVGCPCSAVEPSERMREIARARLPDVEVRAGNAEALPFDAASFDFAFCVNVIHHVVDRPRLFVEAFRVLDDDGSLCVVTESEDMIRQRVVLNEYFPDVAAVDLARYSKVEDLRKMASAAGFSGWREERWATELVVEAADTYEAKAFSSLHLISETAFQTGLARMKADLTRGPLHGTVRAAMLWATK